MNFDFNKNEQSFLNELNIIMQNFCKDKNTESGSLKEKEKNIRDALNALSKTSYLNLGIKDISDLDGMNTLMAAMEIIANFSPSIFLSIESSTRIFGRIISSWADDKLKKELLKDILDGKTIGAAAVCEGTMNVTNEPLKTKGIINGENVIVNGEKTYVVNAPVADWFAVAGKMTDKDVVFLIKNDTKGVLIKESYDTLGYSGAAISSLHLKDCCIPQSQLIGPFEGDEMLLKIRVWENQILIGASLGIMRTAYESAKSYTKVHKTGGKPIIAYQAVAFKLAEMLTLFQTSQLFAYRVAWMAQECDKDAESLTNCAKVFCTENSEKITSDALQIMSGEGYISGNPVERAYRCSKYGQIAGTSTEIAKVKIGDSILRL